MDDALNANQDLFDLGKRCPAGEMTKALTDMFAGMGIDTGDGAVDPGNPDLNDPARKSYRLKGTQNQFTNFDGYPTILG
jgi:hypothetical protein